MLRKNKYHASDSRGTLGIKILVLINVWKKNSLCPSFHSFLAGGLIILTLSIIFLTPMNTLAVKDSSFEDYEIIELGSSKAFRKFNGLDNNRWPNNNVDWYYNPKIRIGQLMKLLPRLKGLRLIGQLYQGLILPIGA